MVSARNNILLWPCDDLRDFIINNIAIPYHPAEGRFILTSIRIAVWQYVPINIVELMNRILRKAWRYQRSNQKSLITLHLISTFSLIFRNAITSFFYNPSRDKNLPILESVEANQIWFWNCSDNVAFLFLMSPCCSSFLFYCFFCFVCHRSVSYLPSFSGLSILDCPSVFSNVYLLHTYIFFVGIQIYSNLYDFLDQRIRWTSTTVS